MSGIPKRAMSIVPSIGTYSAANPHVLPCTKYHRIDGSMSGNIAEGCVNVLGCWIYMIGVHEVNGELGLSDMSVMIDFRTTKIFAK
jgi:hypothetical protein